MKICPICGVEKGVTEFGRNRSLPDGLSFYCLSCNRERSNRWYRDHRRKLGYEVRDHSWIPEGFRWCPSCEQPVAHKDYTRNSRSASGFGGRCKACHNAAGSEAYFYRTYKLTKQELADLRSEQANRCGICGDPDPQHVDHDHDTGGIRQLLCQRCNHGLGLFRDNPRLLHAAAYYVEFHAARQAVAAELDALRDRPQGASRPGTPPVGSQRRPGTQRTSARTTGRSSGARRRQQAGEADE